MKNKATNLKKKTTYSAVQAVTDAVSATTVCDKSFKDLPILATDWKKANTLVVAVYNGQSIEKQVEDLDNLATALSRTKADVLVYQELRINHNDIDKKKSKDQKAALDDICAKLNIYLLSFNIIKSGWKVVQFNPSHQSDKGEWIRGVGIFANGSVDIVDPDILTSLSDPIGMISVPVTGTTPTAGKEPNKLKTIEVLEYARALLKVGDTTYSIYSLYSDRAVNKATRFKGITDYLAAETDHCNDNGFIPVFCGDLNLHKDKLLENVKAKKDVNQNVEQSGSNKKNQSILENFNEKGYADCLNPKWSTHKTKSSKSKIDYVLVQKKDAAHVICHRPQFPKCSEFTHALIIFEMGPEVNKESIPTACSKNETCSYKCK